MRLLLAALFLLIASTASAKALLPASEWNDQTRIALGQAWVAEAGWTADRDHVAIAYVLLKRWQDINKRYPNIRFVDVVRAYCSGLGSVHISKLSPRLRWIRRLEGDEMPEGWPKEVNWSFYRGKWEDILNRVDEWASGVVDDPCRGLADHFGGPMDTPTQRMYLVQCGKTANRFYRLVRVNRVKRTEAKDGTKSNQKGGNSG